MHRISQAKQFAEKAHAGQLRKYTGTPYVEHPIRVSHLVSVVCGDPEVVSAALLHDVLEDTPVKASVLARAFGARVAQLVVAVTDVSRPTDGNRAARKHMNLVHLSTACPAAQTIKLADIIDNISSIQFQDPRFAKVYMAEKRALLHVLERGNARLWETAWCVLDKYYGG